MARGIRRSRWLAICVVAILGAGEGACGEIGEGPFTSGTAVWPRHVSLDFGEVEVGTSATREFWLEARGRVAAHGSVWYVGVDDVTISPREAPLEPMDPVRFSVTFTPTWPGPKRGPIYVHISNAEPRDITVELYAVGVE